MRLPLLVLQEEKSAKEQAETMFDTLELTPLLKEIQRPEAVKEIAVLDKVTKAGCINCCRLVASEDTATSTIIGPTPARKMGGCPYAFDFGVKIGVISVCV